MITAERMLARESGPVVFTISMKTANAALPDKGLTIAMGITSMGTFMEEKAPTKNGKMDFQNIVSRIENMILTGAFKPRERLIVALKLVFPSFLPDIPYLSYGRLRPLHTNAAIFAFGGNAIFIGVYYSLQRLCKARMFSDALSWFNFWGWQAIIVGAAITLPLGLTTSKEYAEAVTACRAAGLHRFDQE